MITKYSCELCNKEYSSRNGLWKHNKTYHLKQNDNIIQHDNSEKELIMMLIKENTEFKNMLMKVVEKIENYNEYTNVFFAPEGCAIDCHIENGFSFSNDCDTKIEAVYSVCIEFIKWYNKCG